MNENVDSLGPVSGEKDSLVAQLREHEAMQNELSNQEPDLRLLLDKGASMVELATPESDVSDLSDKLDSIKGKTLLFCLIHIIIDKA